MTSLSVTSPRSDRAHWPSFPLRTCLLFHVVVLVTPPICDPSSSDIVPGQRWHGSAGESQPEVPEEDVPPCVFHAWHGAVRRRNGAHQFPFLALLDGRAASAGPSPTACGAGPSHRRLQSLSCQRAETNKKMQDAGYVPVLPRIASGNKPRSVFGISQAC